MTPGRDDLGHVALDASMPRDVNASVRRSTDPTSLTWSRVILMPCICLTGTNASSTGLLAIPILAGPRRWLRVDGFAANTPAEDSRLPCGASVSRLVAVLSLRSCAAR